MRKDITFSIPCDPQDCIKWLYNVVFAMVSTHADTLCSHFLFVDVGVFPLSDGRSARQTRLSMQLLPQGGLIDGAVID